MFYACVFNANACVFQAFTHIRDAYAPGGGGDGGVDWWLCSGGGQRRTASIRSYLHVLTVTQAGGGAGPRRRRRQRRRQVSAAVPEPMDASISYSSVLGECMTLSGGVIGYHLRR